MRTDIGIAREKLALGLVGNELDGGEKAYATHLTHERVGLERLVQPALEVRTDGFLHTAHETLLFDDFEILESDRRRDRMTGIGVAVHELFVGIENRFAHAL